MNAIVIEGKEYHLKWHIRKIQKKYCLYTRVPWEQKAAPGMKHIQAGRPLQKILQIRHYL